MENVKKVVRAVLKTANAADKATEDGLGLDDIPLFIEPLMLLGGVVEAAPLAVAEFKALDEAGRSELLAFVEAEFDLRDDKLESVIERALGVAVEVAGVVVDIKALVKAV